MDSEQYTRHKPGSATDPPTAKPRRGPGRRTPSQTTQRNLELLDKALDLFLEKGFERTTIDEITAAVGMAKRTVYLRYGDKTTLFKASLQRAIQEWIVPVDRLRAMETDDAEQTLLRIGQALVENILSPAGLRLMRITNAESGRMPEIGAFTYQQGTAPTVAYLTDLIRRQARRAGTRVLDPQEAAIAFLYLVVGGPASLSAWGINLDPKQVEKHTRYCVRLFLHGLLHAEDKMGSRRLLAAQQPDSPAEQSRNDALEEENRRLKLLLAESMLEISALKEQLALRDRA